MGFVSIKTGFFKKTAKALLALSGFFANPKQSSIKTKTLKLKNIFYKFCGSRVRKIKSLFSAAHLQSAGFQNVKALKFFGRRGQSLTTKQAFSQIAKMKPVAVVLALATALSLFWFMSVLILKENTAYRGESQNLSVRFLSDPRPEDLELRSRRLPKKPEPDKPPPQSPKLKISQKDLPKPQLSTEVPVPDLPDDPALEGKGPAGGGGNSDRSAVPVFRIRPVYPRRAALQNIEGFVLLKFDVNKAGRTENISVLRASPPQIFNSAAIQALGKWKYKAKMENGRPVRQNGLKVKLDFALSDN